MEESTTYEINVSPAGFDGLLPRYELTVYVWRKHGICGPGEEGSVVGYDTIDLWLHERGYARLTPFGPVCSNGFATATIKRTRP